VPIVEINSRPWRLRRDCLWYSPGQATALSRSGSPRSSRDVRHCRSLRYGALAPPRHTMDVRFVQSPSFRVDHAFPLLLAGTWLTVPFTAIGGICRQTVSLLPRTLQLITRLRVKLAPAGLLDRLDAAVGVAAPDTTGRGRHGRRRPGCRWRRGQRPPDGPARRLPQHRCHDRTQVTRDLTEDSVQARSGSVHRAAYRCGRENLPDQPKCGTDGRYRSPWSSGYKEWRRWLRR
jgi:hypothetical protein